MKDFHEYMNELSKPDEALEKRLERLGIEMRAEREAAMDKRIEAEKEKANAQIEKRIRREEGILDDSMHDEYVKLARNIKL